MPGLGSLVSGLSPPGFKRTSIAYLVELGDDGTPLKDSAKPVIRKFQYYPDSVSDTKAVNYATKEVPGGSLPLYQYINSGERVVSFTAVFTSDIDFFADQGEGVLEPALFNPTSDAWDSESKKVNGLIKRAEASGVGGRNVFIPAAILWLRRFVFPRYGTDREVESALTRPPSKLLLVMPGTGFARSGGTGGTGGDSSGMTCIMTQCDVTYEALFPSGCPRKVSVSLSQTAQTGGTVVFPRASANDDDIVNKLYRLNVPVAKSDFRP
jgi:hypothetical protein